ncbi:MAG: hypothetical protein PHX08_14565 [Lachnospiraceae bacterium]|nr:hypothetical protein [Lachnospiraceae bacterium]
MHSIRREEIVIENFWYDLLLAFLSALLGAVFGIIIPKIIGNNQVEGNVKVDKQLFFQQIHVEQNYNINNQVIYTKKNSKNTGKSQEMSGSEMLFLYLLGSLFLIYAFLKFETQISMILLSMTVFLESTFITIFYFVTKNYYIDKSLKTILRFNIFATFCSPLLLYLMKNPITNLTINKNYILNQINSEGVFSLLKDVDIYGFLLYQAFGVVFLFGFMFFTLIGTMHILAMVNLTLDNRLKNIWKRLYVITLNYCKSLYFYIGFGMFLLVLSFIFVSGLMTNFMNR